MRNHLFRIGIRFLLAPAFATAGWSQTFSIDGPSPSHTVWPARVHLPDSLLLTDPASTGEDIGGLGPLVNFSGTKFPRHTFGPFMLRDVDGISSNHGSIVTPAPRALRIVFSVRRPDIGDLGTCVEDQRLLNQEAGDLFVSSDAWRPVPPAGGHVYFAAGASNLCYINQQALDEAPSVPDTAFVPAGMPIDNLDGFDFRVFDTNTDGTLDLRLYYSVSLATDADFGAYIFTLPVGWNAAPADPLDLGPIYATREQLRLTSGDDLDGLVVYDANNNGVYDPGDCVLLSLMAGSTSLNVGFPYHFAGMGNPADVFMAFRVNAITTVVTRLAPRELLGFSGGAGYADIDALEVASICILAGDLNCDCVVDILDINPFVLAVGDAAAYHAAYPLCWIDNADMNADGSIDVLDINPFIDLVSGG
ncbi:hypothetical protein RAS1_18270 [Phycisphaerae bacterium RAS1]|nr:hypothetical protein RAS1_18270 [Phycisphaerae bacterium RAS1]